MDTPVTRAYAGKTIFVTGSTGFVGKTLLEKIIYAVPDIKRIYVLVREKRGVEGSERTEQLIKSPIFAGPGRISQDVLRTKIVPLYGDLSQPRLGFSDQHWNLVVNEVNFVFHCAASIRFDDPVKVALKINYVGTKAVADLCHEMKHLEAFVHVSTCYSNSHLDVTEEKVYKTKITGEQLMEMSTKMEDKEFDQLVETNYFEGRKNSYIFTKAVAENYVADTCQGLPVAIVRLPIVVPAILEPEPCLTDTVGALNFLALITALGTSRSFRYDPKSKLQILPVDHAVNGLILVGHQLTTSRSNQVKVFNMAPGDACKVTFGSFMRTAYAASQQTHSYHRIRPVADVTRPSSYLGHKYKHYVFELLYAIILDLLYLVMGKKACAYANTAQMSGIRDSTEYFHFHSPLLKTDNYRKLNHGLDMKDQETFNVNLRDVEKVFHDKEASLSYMTKCMTSYMKYKLKETVTASSVADRKQYMKKETLATIVLHAILLGMVYLVYFVIYVAIDAYFST